MTQSWEQVKSFWRECASYSFTSLVITEKNKIRNHIIFGISSPEMEEKQKLSLSYIAITIEAACLCLDFLYTVDLYSPPWRQQ